uniref:Laminin, alpha 5 n=1 Tax=Sparus aurata TaxID=8175 RepID=A0A671Z2E7_SPAAU
MASGPAPLAAAAAELCPALRARTRAALLLLWPLLLLLLLRSSVSAQELPTNGVNGYSLHPPYFNLAEGTKITATATCGEEEGGRTVHDLYCKLVGGPVSGDPSQTIQGQYCDICSQGDSDRAHPITNAIDGTERWWQSPPLSRSTEFNEVNVTLDLGQLFHVAYVLIKFANSPRPDLWVLERSVDFGQTYLPWQYFASSKRDCIERFGLQTIERINSDNDVICTSEYSRIVPLENGEIVVSLVNGRPGAMNFSYSPVLRDFTKATNIRLRFLRTNTLLGHLMGKALRDPTVTRRYYYSIKDISIGGRCVCNGHAEACNAEDPIDPYKLQCDCQHNTCGLSCDQCCPGYNQLPWKPATTYSANECEPCNCHRHSFDCYYDPEVDQRRGSLDIHGHSRGGGVCLNCQHHTTGVNCERCIPTYYRSPDHPIESPLACSRCNCQSEFTDGTCEDRTGRCFCKPNYSGENCDSCASGFVNFPDCYPVPTYPTNNNNGEAKPAGEIISCQCSVGSLPEGCDASGRCLCRPEFQGPRCEQCRSGFHSYPNCQACQCSAEGSRYTSCDQVSGQCVCLPSVVGLRCDSCGQCECRPHVEGLACDTCKPLYWNLSPDTPEGCSNCECNIAGTVSGVAECSQETGQCFCKPNACSGTCSTCKDGYYNLQEQNYFGCQGCQCDVGGSAGQSCGERNGRCRCRPNVEGPKCNLPRPDHYFPDLHHLKFEIEEGTTMDGRPVRFGYNPLEFKDFSWRGYAQMSPIQVGTLLVSVSVSSPDLFHVVLRYANRVGSDVLGRVSVIEDGSEQSKQIVFAPSVEPTFVNVPQNNFVEPFVLNPGTWTVVIEAEGILLDYLVLLPSAYYEAPILQIKVTEPCTYSAVPDASQNCLQYRYLSLDSFPSISGNDANCVNDNHLPRPCPTERVTPRHPDMAVCSGYDISVEMRERLPSAGDYVLVIEYSSEDELPQTLSVAVNMPGARTHQHRVTLLHCKYSFLCRVVAVDEQNRVAVLSLPADAEIQLIAEQASFFLHKVYLVPKDQFTMEHVEPKVHCISTHGQFSPDSSSCVPSRFQTPSDSLVLKEGQSSSMQEPILASPANAAVYSTRVHALGRYVFILHYHQPRHPTYPVQVYINGGRIWQGHANASFCPHAYGCRNVLISENQIILDVTDHELFLTVQIPAGKTLWLDYILVVPESSYSSSHLNEEPLDKSYDFISNCGQNIYLILLGCCCHFYFLKDCFSLPLPLSSPTTASPFCLGSAVSLSAFFNNGAMPCACHEVGAESDTCEQFGGQCSCRPNVIGRDCSMCATGYWGFPNCRPCNCGTRLCEPVTGDCICPPRTMRPECTQCEPQTFGCHPVVGCEVCNCSRPGIVTPDVSCDTLSGQCRCKNNVVGRQCDRCAPGFYGYPNCRPCDCNEAGTEEDVCDSFTGQCLCKENVQGSRCDQCRVGTFHLDPTNPKGCTSCFCFGATDRCRSSDKRRTEIMNMEGWVLLGADKQEVPVVVYPGQDLVEADLSDVPDVYQDLHWHAPKTYLGDKVRDEGRPVERFCSTGNTQRENLTGLKTQNRRNSGGIMKICAFEEYSSPEEPHLGIVHMVEGSFRHAQTGNSVSREELMMVLVGLESLQIRALHSQSAHSVSLRGAVLEGAESLPAGRHANNVEICMCPANYLGDSCQKCAPGYYRDTIGLFLGKCVPCNCNGHSDQCLDGSGICVGCRHNTDGDHCERCQGGFLGNNTLDGQAVSCSSCPCPLRVPFAEGCEKRGDRMQCLCMPGYAGPHCERCAPGHYGNPMVLGSTCQLCHCNDNTDPNMLFTDCHQLTGECLSCMHNTAGPHCDTSCDSCVIVLLEDLDKLNDNFHSVADQLKSLNASSMAWAHTLDESRNRADMLDAEIINLNDDINELQDKAMVMTDRVGDLRDSTNNTHQRAEDLLSFINNITMDLNVLDRVNKELAGRQGENNDLAKTIRDRLTRFNSEMMDLRDALNEAVNNTARASELNNINEKTLEDNKKEVNDQLQMAEDDVAQVNDVLTMLHDSKEYERLAAKLDGARTPLAKKVQEFGWVDSKIPLVEEAEKHAELLNALTWIHLEISDAKRAADAANTTATQVNDALRPIKEQLDQWQQTYGDANATNEDINNALMELDKLQNHSAQMPNISENIDRIRQLIQQARNAASKVGVPVKFNGESGVQVRTPRNLADLAAYTSLKFYITLPEAARARRQDNGIKQFVFYLGNKDSSKEFLGMTLEGKKLRWYFNVGGETAEVLTPQDIKSDGNFNKGPEEIKRTFKADGTAGGDQGLLNLLTDDTVFYVGGYPSTFKPPPQLALPNFKGCIELDTLNEDVLSLYNFEKIFKLNTTYIFKSVCLLCVCVCVQDGLCQVFLKEGHVVVRAGNSEIKTQKTYNDDNSHYVSIYNDNNGSVSRVFHLITLCLCRPHISMSVRINSSDGLVLYAAGGQRGAVMSLSVSDGHLLLLLDGGKRKVSLRSRKKYNDDQWHTVRSHREGEKISLIVDGISAQSKRLPGGDRTRLTGPLYVGGVPPSLTAPGSGGFVGCVRDLTLNEAPAGSPAHSQGTVPCFQDPLQPGAYFSGQGGNMAIGDYHRSSSVLEVRPVSDSGLLLHAGMSPDQHLSLVLSQGEVTVSVNTGKGEFSTSFTPEESLCNGRWHTITGELTSLTCL